jgi:hypothetical protein
MDELWAGAIGDARIILEGGVLAIPEGVYYDGGGIGNTAETSDEDDIFEAAGRAECEIESCGDPKEAKQIRRGAGRAGTVPEWRKNHTFRIFA